VCAQVRFFPGLVFHATLLWSASLDTDHNSSHEVFRWAQLSTGKAPSAWVKSDLMTGALPSVNRKEMDHTLWWVELMLPIIWFLWISSTLEELSSKFFLFLIFFPSCWGSNTDPHKCKPHTFALYHKANPKPQNTFFIFLNSGPCTCEAGTLPHEPHLQHFLH
jgi:hypothetical protein